MVRVKCKVRLILVILLLWISITMLFFVYAINLKNYLHISLEPSRFIEKLLIRETLLLPFSKPNVTSCQECFPTVSPRNVRPWKTLLHLSYARTATVLTRTSTSWRIQNGVCDLDTGDFKKATLKSPAGDTPIFIYPKAQDVWVSRDIIERGIWEGDLVQMTYEFMTKHADADFVDIGANVGVYGLTIAKMGRRVVLIDPLLGNVRRLCKSIREGQFQNEAYVIHNAISDKRFRVGFGTHPGNVGGTYVKEMTSANDAEVAQAIPLDDLLSIFNFTKVVIKMDIEGHETRALLGGDRFFSTVNVVVVQMEWALHRKDGIKIIKFLTRHNMKPYYPAMKGSLLDVNSFQNWPGDIVWKKNPSVIKSN
ncbi:uncharacterized protein LOC121370473 [Gigantopelta aegis]|uniref:uncharacterized protein LOC121370473 n=1 Tax=Gigantopelta aegis TaxID=1735272 RepID=UPI001B88AA65|nr:uncharacterized protein LOC121370473 [Gigantopelta aegis]